MAKAEFSIINDVEWVTITVNKDLVVERVAKEEDRIRFKGEYSKFKKENEHEEPPAEVVKKKQAPKKKTMTKKA